MRRVRGALLQAFAHEEPLRLQRSTLWRAPEINRSSVRLVSKDRTRTKFRYWRKADIAAPLASWSSRIVTQRMRHACSSPCQGHIITQEYSAMQVKLRLTSKDVDGYIVRS